MLFAHCRSSPFSDLTVSNILLSKSAAKVADFGLSRERSRRLAQEAPGAAVSCAPEVLRKEAVTQSADVFSFAMVLYELVTQRGPQPNMRNLMQYITDIVNGYVGGSVVE